MNSKVVKFILFISLSIDGMAQKIDISGNWQGVLIQPNSPVTTSYSYWLQINQSGDSISGQARTEVANTFYYAIISFTGRIESHKILINQQRIIKSVDPPNVDSWCLIYAELNFQKQYNELSGIWTSANQLCEGGTIILAKSNRYFNTGNNNLKRHLDIDTLFKDKEHQLDISNYKFLITRLNYKTNEYKLDNTTKAILDRIVKYLNVHKNLKVNIEGHTDETGSDEYNFKLSFLRAKEVYQYLISRNIHSNRLSFEGFGKTKPLRESEVKNDWSNRRVAFVFTE